MAVQPLRPETRDVWRWTASSNVLVLAGTVAALSMRPDRWFGQEEADDAKVLPLTGRRVA